MASRHSRTGCPGSRRPQSRMPRCPRMPDLIISDCTLPAFDGVSAFAIAAAETPEIPFVFVSGTLGDERAREALKHGAAGYVAKGNREDLAQTIRSALERAPARHRRASDRPPLSAGADPGTGAA